MRNQTNQITPQGIANRSGLEVFVTEEIYSGEYINWGNALALGTGLNSVIDRIVSGDSVDPIYDALTSSSPTQYTTGHWNRFHTETGTKNYVVAAPTSGSGYFTFNAASSAAKLSYAGIYQQLSTTVGTEYEIEVTNTTDTDTATLYVNTYFQRYNPDQNEVGYKINTTANKTYPVTFEQDCILTSTFTAKTPNDFIVIYLTTTSASASVNITNISIKQKQETLIPVYSEDIYGNSQKVLRRNLKNERLNS
tara:strand:+ start:3334 stop:4086 length:753 start_codon:yes stop_codon:yes gene_type:complete